MKISGPFAIFKQIYKNYLYYNKKINIMENFEYPDLLHRMPVGKAELCFRSKYEMWLFLNSCNFQNKAAKLVLILIFSSNFNSNF